LCSKFSCSTAAGTHLHALVFWNDILIDGYNWYYIRTEHYIPFVTVLSKQHKRTVPLCSPCARPPVLMALPVPNNGNIFRRLS